MNFIDSLALTVKSAVKIILQSKPGARPKAQERTRPLLLLGNGPSLPATLEELGDEAGHMDILAVNFAANTPLFFELKPKYYVIADPHFFENGSDPNVARLTEALGRVDWPMTLFVPARARGLNLPEGSTVATARFNFVGAEGFGWFTEMVYGARLAMPRPRNVLIPSLMIGLWLGYKKLLLAGADHSWTRTLEVNDRNEVVSVQPHFYSESASERERVASVYRGVRLHEILLSFHIAFKAYFAIAAYARRIGAKVVNLTPGSFIDAFPRQSASALRR